MKPSERAKVATQTIGDIVGAKIEPGQRIEDYLLTEFTAAERDAFEAAREPDYEWVKTFGGKMLRWSTYEDWRGQP